MKVDTFTKDLPFHKNGNYQGVTAVLHCRVSCDICTNNFQYEGTAAQAPQKAKDCGWTVGATGLCRCKECTRRKEFIINDVLDRRYSW